MQPNNVIQIKDYIRNKSDHRINPDLPATTAFLHLAAALATDALNDPTSVHPQRAAHALFCDQYARFKSDGGFNPDKSDYVWLTLREETVGFNPQHGIGLATSRELRKDRQFFKLFCVALQRFDTIKFRYEMALLDERKDRDRREKASGDIVLPNPWLVLECERAFKQYETAQTAVRYQAEQVLAEINERKLRHA